MAAPKKAANTPNTASIPPRAASGGTASGARMEAILPNPAAAPAPVAASPARTTRRAQSQKATARARRADKNQ